MSWFYPTVALVCKQIVGLEFFLLRYQKTSAFWWHFRWNLALFDYFRVFIIYCDTYSGFWTHIFNFRFLENDPSQGSPILFARCCQTICHTIKRYTVEISRCEKIKTRMNGKSNKKVTMEKNTATVKMHPSRDGRQRKTIC